MKSGHHRNWAWKALRQPLQCRVSSWLTQTTRILTKAPEKVNILDCSVFWLFVLQRTWAYSVFEVYDIEWEEPEVGTTGSVGKVTFPSSFSWKIQKKDPKHWMGIVLLDEVNVDVLPDGTFIVYHMKAFMDQAQPRLLLENKRLLTDFSVLAQCCCWTGCTMIIR